MSRTAAKNRRRGTTTVEFAITCPIVFFLVFATIIGGLGVFRYQQVAAAAREGARWASVHGTDWNRSNQPLEVVEDFERPIGNTVSVTVTYQWFPEAYLVGPITLSSTSTAQMIY